MKIIVIGGTGTIGKAVVKDLAKRHTVIIAGHNHGDMRVDITDVSSLEYLYRAVGNFDAVVTTVGKVHFDNLTAMTPDNYFLGLENKLMGQVNVVLVGLRYINPHGSFTLTSGILSHDPIIAGSSASMVNGAIDSFVKAAAIEMPNNTRINAVSPTVLADSIETYGEYFAGFEPVSSYRVALAYVKSIEGAQTGQVYNVGY